MAEEPCCTQNHQENRRAKIRDRIAVFLSIPWCCVVSLAIAGITTTGSLLGFFFDELMHDVVPLLVVFHLYGIYRYAHHQERTRGRTIFLVLTPLLFFVSVGFHFTELHDHVLGYEHEHH